jgi:hypothetical protein
MVLDIQTVHHILKNTAVQNVNKHYGLDFHFNKTANESKFSKICRPNNSKCYDASKYLENVN